MNTLFGRRFIAKLLSILATSWGAGAPLLASKGQVKLQAPLKPSQEREDYQECITAVIRKYKTFDPVKRVGRIKYGIETCRDRYPAVSIMVECKKSMTAAYKDNPSDLKSAIAQCREEYAHFAFNPKQRIPFALKEDLAYFAGAGLNRTLSIAVPSKGTPPATLPGSPLSENYGNYACNPLLGVSARTQLPEYLLFGNDPLLYTPLRHANREAMATSLGIKNPKQPQMLVHRELGELYFEPKTQEMLNYFPSSYCFFNRALGPLFEGIKIYYLLDRTLAQVTPYFGVAFYKPEAKINAVELTEEIRQTLGRNYQTSQAKDSVHLIAATPLKSFDSEQDPKNVCGPGQPSPFIALVSANEEGIATYAMLANTANLCRFGDRVASRLLKKGLELNRGPDERESKPRPVALPKAAD